MKKSVQVDLIKIIATVSVVFVHSMANYAGGGYDQYLYLLGCYGVPLFFVVNGYLTYGKQTGPHLKKKIMAYGGFMVKWSIAIGILAWIKKGEFLVFPLMRDTILGGGGYLFHLWFMSSLIILHVLHYFANSWLKKLGKSMETMVSFPVLFIAVIILNMIFCFDAFYLMPERSLVAIIPTPYRLFRYIVYYLFGLYLRKRMPTLDSGKCRFALPILMCGSWAAVCILSNGICLADAWSVSSFYPSLPVTAGVVGCFVLGMNLSEKNNKFWGAVRYIAPTSVGVYVMHPFVLSVLNKCAAFVSLPLTAGVCLCETVVTVILCALATNILLRVKYVCSLFRM